MGESAQVDVLCMACDDKLCDFRPRRLVRRPLGPHDVLLHLSFCGVCHSDLHIASEHMRGIGMKTEYPIVPGHELAGVCVQVGHAVTKIKVGDHVGALLALHASPPLPPPLLARSKTSALLWA
eukprot:scaffold75527_cov31-Tisochrysis_lutea.AAC.2